MYFAYEDDTRLKSINACDTFDRNKRFYCPNHKCDAHIFLASTNGIKKKHFKAKLISHPHIDKCPHRTGGFNKSDFIEKAFNLENFFGSLIASGMSKSKQSSTKSQGNGTTKSSTVIKSIRQLYELCRRSSIYDSYNGYRIAEIIVFEETLHIYTKYVSGFHIVKGTYIDCNHSKLEVYTSYDLSNPKAKITMKFSSKALFDYYVKEFTTNAKNTMIVGGFFRSGFCEIQSKDQLYVLPLLRKRTK